jgi:outer membrane protein OmpA-like peptidoglycan-associated protein
MTSQVEEISMSIKSRLFASVAAPLVSLPLMMQPAFAVPPKIAIPAASTGDVIRVQGAVILPPGAVPEEEQAPAEAPAEEAPAEEAPAEEAPAEATPEPAPEVIQEAPAEVQPEAPAPEPEAVPTPEPEPEAEAAPEAAPEPEATPEEAPAETAPEAAPAEEAPAAETAPEAEEAPAEEEAPAATSEQPAEETAPASEETAPTSESTQQPAEAPAADAPVVLPEGEAPATATEGATETAPAEGTTGAPAQTTTEGAAAPEAGQAAPAGQPPVATTTEDVQRAQEIADDPSAAQEGETAVLPVENGAAVLDSQKETAPVATAPAGTTAAPADGSTAPAPAQAPAQASAPVAAPTSDAEAQAPMQARQRSEFRASTAEAGERIDGRPEYRRTEGWGYRDGDRDRRDGDRRDGRRDRDGRDDRGGEARIIISIGERPVVYHDDTSRFYGDDGDVYYERLPGDRYREVVERPGGVQVVTIRNSSGSVVQRSRIVDGEEYVLYYAPELYEDADYVWRDPALDLPPMRLSVPLDQYIIDTSSDPDRDYYEFLDQPPVEQVERVYSLDEVRYSARIRDKARRIDLDTVKFATGSAEIPMNEASSLRKVAEAMNKILEENPAETFLIEGHTDAVGSDESNLILSDERAESVAVVLTDAFGIPPENLATQGYGERFLKIRTEGPEQDNRRVTIRRITPLVKPVASNQ